MNVLLMNLNVGSAIEYVGGVIKKWIQELPVQFIEYKDQTKESVTIDFIIGAKPDIIVVNETYPRIIAPVLYYKKFNPKTKIILLVHSHKTFLGENETNPHVINQHTLFMDLVKLSDVVFTLDAKPLQKNMMSNIQVKFCPSEPEIFSNKLKWSDRPKLFCIVGNIYPLKICKEFLLKAKTIPVEFDVYGRFMEKFSDESYKNIFKDAIKENLKFKGEIPQSEVGRILNGYKYCVFPHHGAETFFMTLAQAAMCGTIPILLNDESGREFNPDWVTWAENLYLGCADIKNFIWNLKLVSENPVDYTILSNHISKDIANRFNYEKFKQEFQLLLENP